MAGLAVGAGILRGRGYNRVRGITFVHITIGHAFNDAEIGCSLRIYCLNSYQITSGHFSRHRLTHPTAQRQ